MGQVDLKDYSYTRSDEELVERRESAKKAKYKLLTKILKEYKNDVLRRHTAKWIWMEMVSRRLSYGHLQIRQQKVEDISIRSMLTMMQN